MALALLSNSQLRPYLDDVRAWHGFVRFLGLPTIQDHPDTPLSDLFVAPLLSMQRVTPESPSGNRPSGQSVFAALEAHPRMVLLGDPGSGKSMIVNWLAWLLAGGAAGVLPGWLEDVLPIPLVARELKLDGVKRFDDLVSAFLERPVAAHLRGQRGAITLALDEGRALVLLDGLDEVPLALRESLREAVRDGWKRYPKARFLATSRSVGYDECRLDLPKPARPTKQAGPATVELLRDLGEFHRSGDVPVLHVLPFDDARIAAFAQQWYRLRSIKQSAEQDADAFVRALQKEANVLELARTPQLLTLMALVFRVRAHLPDGRAMLYDMITEAYLESIDRSRKVGKAPEDRYPWHEKRRWLARVGFEMQMLRSERRDPSGADQRELLATRGQVLEWVRAAMRQSSYPADNAFAVVYLDWVARRSGLLLPRGEDLFAFVHLSFQEYFAALYLVEHLSDAEWVMAQREGSAYSDGDSRVTAPALAGWSKSTLWQETLVFASECFAHRPKDARRLSSWLFGAGFAEFASELSAIDNPPTPELHDKAAARGELLSRLLTNPHSGLTVADRQAGMPIAMLFLERVEGRFDDVLLFSRRTTSLRRLLATPETRQGFWSATRARNPIRLKLDGCSEVDWRELQFLSQLRDLSAHVVDDDAIAQIARLPSLEVLWLHASGVTTLAPLAKLIHLHTLGVYESPVADIEPLATLTELTYLSLVRSRISNLEALSGLVRLQNLFLSETPVESIEPLRHCVELRFLDLTDTPVVDLSPLNDLVKLQTLRLSPRAKLTRKLSELQAARKLQVLVSR